jgi:hypothetical protein
VGVIRKSSLDSFSVNNQKVITKKEELDANKSAIVQFREYFSTRVAEASKSRVNFYL